MATVFAPSLFADNTVAATVSEGAPERRNIPQIKLSFVCDPGVKYSKPCTCSSVISEIFRQSYEAGEIEYREIMKVAYFNHALKLIGVQTVSIGNQSACISDVKGIFAGALLCRASAFALCHNHPSGTLRPSPQDDALTKRLNEGARILELRMIDHIILTDDGFYSYHDNGNIL